MEFLPSLTFLLSGQGFFLGHEPPLSSLDSNEMPPDQIRLTSLMERSKTVLVSVWIEFCGMWTPSDESKGFVKGVSG